MTIADKPIAAVSVSRRTREAEFGEAFARFLLARGLIDELALRRAQQAAARTQERLDVVATRLGLIDEAQAARAMAETLALPFITPEMMPSAPILADRLPRAFLETNKLIPVRLEESGLLVAVADPFNLETVTALAFLLEQPVRHAIGAPREIELAIERLYGKGADDAQGRALASPQSAAAGTDDADVRRLADLASDAPVIRLVQDLIVRAVEARASDIHIEPREDCVEVRYRIDGALHTIERLPTESRAAIASRVKVMARLDIAERRLPQDGRIAVAVRGRDIDLRVSCMPTLNGESLVLRILDRSSVPLELPALGFGGPTLEKLTSLIQAPSGIVLVTGPTGSGKTTTLYTALGLLNDNRRKIFTVEDPIEYQLAGISQVQVEPRIGLGFATALRALLRQDPDILMVGEIRDLETAEVAVQASLTGHLVLSTVHTNSAAATVARLVNMGVEDYLLASSLTGVVAQRLVRRLCSACAEPALVSALKLERLRADAGAALQHAALQDSGRLMRKVGCAACRGTGYHGRLSVNEILLIDTDVSDAMLARADERNIEAATKAQGMTTMYQDGLAKALGGLTTIEEVLRATRVAA